MSVTVTYKAKASVAEILPANTGSASDASRTVTHTQYDEEFTLNSGSTPPVTLQAQFLLTLSSGAGTIDLRNLVGTNGAAVDGNGLKVQVLRFKNLGANAMTLTFGASNPADLLGATGVLKVWPGGHVQIFTNDGPADIDGTHKTIDVSGTGSQTAEVTVIMG